MRDPSFAPPASVLADSGIPNTISPTGGMGLTLDALGNVPIKASSAVPRVRVYNSANISINNNTVTTVTFDSERFDSEGMHDLTTNTSRLTVQTAGVYQIWAGIRFAANVTGRRALVLLLNGATFIAADSRMPVTDAGIGTNCTIATLYQLAVGDYVEVTAFQLSGGALNVEVTANAAPEFGMSWIGPIVT